MSALLLLATGFALIMLPGKWRASRLSPAEWARVTAASLLAGLVAVELGLVLLALPAITHLLTAKADSTCVGFLDGSIGGLVVSWTMAVIACVIAWRVARVAINGRHAMRTTVAELWLGDHYDRGDFNLVVLPTDRTLALSVPASPPQVLISQGLVDLLDEDELDAVIQHEASHLRCKHWRYSILALCVERAFSRVPGARRSADTLRAALELWADNDASADSDAKRSNVLGAISAVAGSTFPHHDRSDGVLERARVLASPKRVVAFPLRLALHAPTVIAIVGAALLAGGLLGNTYFHASFLMVLPC